MSSDAKFWIVVLSVFVTFVLLVLLISTVGDYEEKKMMAEKGYEQVWDASGNKTLWKKARD